MKSATRLCGQCRTEGSPHPCSRCPLRRLEKRSSDVDALGPKRPSAIIIDGRIRLEGEIGRGGMGTVFCGIDETLDRVVAVKFLLPEFHDLPVMVERFRQEARATAAINHPNVIRIYSAGRFGASDYFVAEYVDGFTLHHVIQVRRAIRQPLPPSCALWIFEQICTGLAEVHVAGVVHRDMKPSNVMIEADTGRVVIMDFGLGIIHGKPDEDEDAVRGGTPTYMAPELINEELAIPQLEHSPDIYSIGIVLHELLTGEVPFKGANWVNTLDMHLLLEPPQPSAIRPGIPQELDSLVRRCLAKDPNLRYGSCGEILEDLAQISSSLSRYAPSNERRSIVSVVSAQDPTEPLSRDASEAPTRVESQRELVLPSRIVVSSSDPEVLGIVRRSIRRMQPCAFVHVTSSPSAALDAARQLEAQVVVISLKGSEVAGFEEAAMLDRHEERRTPRLLLLADDISVVDRSMLEKRSGAEVLPLPTSLDEVGEALVNAASLIV